ncbi:MAG: large conductance mechanosensitive channel protein MscL [Quisquiliibacterium sp.]
MGMLNEFKTFAMKGNVMDLAVGVIIGGAFGKIVSSLVDDVIMPVASAILGGKLDFSSLLVPLGRVPEGTAMTLDALRKAGIPVFAYGNFVTILVNFVLLAFVIFLMVKVLNRWKNEAPATPAAPAAPPASEVLLAEIRDLLKQRAP